MPFFPLSNINDIRGYCTVHNFSPNNWEKVSLNNKFLWAIYSDGNRWITKQICKLNQGESKTVYYDEFALDFNSSYSPIIILQLRKTSLPKYLDKLPDHEFNFTNTPQWRSTVGFKYLKTTTSYQGEINPFPIKASLITFHPFIQYNEIENYFVFLNLELNPKFRYSKIEIYNSNNLKFIDEVKIRNNSTNIIPLNAYKFKQEELPVFICRDMAGIPFGFGINYSAPMLSLEHTHPPGSLIVHGNRFKSQKTIKANWFSILKKDEN